jgi:hypothetical protein
VPYTQYTLHFIFSIVCIFQHTLAFLCYVQYIQLSAIHIPNAFTLLLVNFPRWQEVLFD